MNPLKKIIPLACLILSAGSLMACQKSNAGNDVYTEDGKLKISMRNLYFESWAGGDVYTDTIQDQFKVSITPSTYSYNDWTSQVSAAVNAGNLTDVFQFNVTQFNFANSYKFWAEGQVIKALPDDLSAWPNIKNLIDNTSDIDSLKIDGHLYGLPIAKNIAEPKVNYSPFTYVYRRDWAKTWGVYQDNDVYTWEQFTNLINTFNTKLNPSGNSDKYALADVEWGFPSLTNFYKQVPHCFAFDGHGEEIRGQFRHRRLYPRPWNWPRTTSIQRFMATTNTMRPKAGPAKPMRAITAAFSTRTSPYRTIKRSGPPSAPPTVWMRISKWTMPRRS
jgi:ABC-type glycerol-3-phosphate transport system substrate-binding protein